MSSVFFFLHSTPLEVVLGDVIMISCPTSASNYQTIFVLVSMSPPTTRWQSCQPLATVYRARDSKRLAHETTSVLFFFASRLKKGNTTAVIVTWKA